MLIKVNHDYSSHTMSPAQLKYWYHFFDGDEIIGGYVRSQIRQNPQFRREVLNQPVCVKCEKFGFWHKGGVQCPTCGHWAPENQTHKVKIHLKEGHYQ